MFQKQKKNKNKKDEIDDENEVYLNNEEKYKDKKENDIKLIR